MRRSNSTSHIPLPKSDSRSRAKSSVRTSKDVTSSTKKTRPLSTERLAPPNFKRSSSFSNFRKQTLTPTLAALKQSKKSVGLTPTLGASGFVRSSSVVTPASSQKKSPYKIGSERSVSDKKWINEQFLKVRRYLQEHTSCQEHIPDFLKPPTINTFAYVMNILLKEIDPRIEINNVNYKDIVFNTLKTLHYPGSISQSLLKTVNTMHAWPQVVSIFAWLIDLITTIKRVDSISPAQAQDPKYTKVQCVLDYIVERYLRYNNGENEEIADMNFRENFARILNIDEDENKQLEENVAVLSQLKEKQTETLTKQKAENDRIRSQIDGLQNEIDTFYLNKDEKHEDIDCAITSLTAKREKLRELIRKKRENIVNLTETIKVQPCTVKEKKRMLKHVDELKHTIKLKKEKAKAKKEFKDNHEFKLVEAKKKVETEVYCLNNGLRKLCSLEPDLKILYMKETDFLSEDFENDIQELVKNVKLFENKFSSEITQLKSLVSKLATENSSLEQQNKSAKEALNVLKETENLVKKKIELYNQNLANMHEKRKEQKNEFKKIMEKLKAEAPDVDQVAQQLEELEKLKNEKKTEFQKLKEQSLEFFVKLHKIMMGNLVDMNNVRTEVFEVLQKCLTKVQKSQQEILEDLHELEELKK